MFSKNRKGGKTIHPKKKKAQKTHKYALSLVGKKGKKGTAEGW